MEGRGMGRGTQGEQDGHYRYFQVLTRRTFRKESREFGGGGLGWMNRGRKDHGFACGKVRDGGKQLF